MSGSYYPEVVASIVALLGRGRDAALPLLLAIQDRFGYLPEEALLELIRQTDCNGADLKGLATFFDDFRFSAAGVHRVHVCTGTACHSKGASAIVDSLRRRFGIKPGEDTDEALRVTLREAQCFGCCTLASVVAVDGDVLGDVSADDAAHRVDAALARSKSAEALSIDREVTTEGYSGEVRVGLGSCCTAKGARELLTGLGLHAQDMEAPVRILAVGCVGACSRTPFVEITTGSGDVYHYENVPASAARAILTHHFQDPRPWRRLARIAGDALVWLADPDDEPLVTGTPASDSPISHFFAKQYPIATEHHGALLPVDLADYRAHGGVVAWDRCRDGLDPAVVLEHLEASGLRGRGGAGYLTARKWQAVRDAAVSKGVSPVVAVNGDEGDPGAFMDRMLMESYPLRILEGALIAAFAVGARQVIVHVRREYPLALERLKAALAAFSGAGLFGESLEIRIVTGAGAFVCGEETALLAALSGDRPMPRLRPPYPSELGLNGRPTLVNNVETLAMVPWIMREGAAEFAALGSSFASGTKVLALAGKVRHGGLVEVPMGTTLHAVVEELGGGALDGRRIKAVQVGGPSGGCVPAAALDTPVDYKALEAIGGAMGSGGIVVLDDTDCMVEITRYFVTFSRRQSCGRCSVGRVGTMRLQEGLDALCEGRARSDELERLDEVVETLRLGALCGLCRSAPNPYLSTRRHFPEEYQEHLAGTCRSGSCRDLVRFSVSERCCGCTICAGRCPVSAIKGLPHGPHVVDQGACIKCGTCADVCPFDAVEVTER